MSHFQAVVVPGSQTTWKINNVWEGNIHTITIWTLNGSDGLNGFGSSQKTGLFC